MQCGGHQFESGMVHQIYMKKENNTHLELKKISEKSLWNGYRKVEEWVFESPKGVSIDYEIKKEGSPVCVLALTKDRKVIIVKVFRPGPMKVLYELPGGGKGKGEDALEAIKRELLEETGYTGDFEFIGTSLADAYSTMLRSNFVATNCVKIKEIDPVDREPQEVALMSLDEFREHLRTGELTDIATGYMGLDYLNLL